jgi:hypothetical protein
MSQGFTKGTPIDTDPTLSLNSDIVVPSQKAVKSYLTANYQPTLVSGTNIKTINGNTLLGSGDLTIGGGGITVGTTPVTSGTSGRVLFENTGVVKESANFYWDDTNARLSIRQGSSPGAVLDVRAAGTASTDIAWRVRNTANSDNLAYVSGNGLAVIGINASTSPTLIIDPSGSARATLRGGTNQSILLNSSGWNNLNGGSGGWDIEATGGEIRQRNGSNYTLLSGNYFGIGRTPGARLDVQAQGALSTDIIQRWRNSANSANIGKVTGDGAFTIGTYTNPSTQLTLSSSLTYGMYVEAVTGIYAQNQQGSGSRYGIQALGRSNVVGATAYGIKTGADSSSASTINYGLYGYAYNGATNYAAYLDSQGGTTNYALYIQRGDILLGNATTNKIGFWNATPIVQPTTAIASATIVSPGGGTNIKTDDTFDGFTLAQVVKALRNLGILQ